MFPTRSDSLWSPQTMLQAWPKFTGSRPARSHCWALARPADLPLSLIFCQSGECPGPRWAREMTS